MPLFGFVPDYYATVGGRGASSSKSSGGYSIDPDKIFDEIDREINDFSKGSRLSYDLGEIETFEI